MTRALASRWPVVDVYLAPTVASTEAATAAALAAGAGITVTELGEAAFRKVAYRAHPDGILAVGRMMPHRLGDLEVPAAPLLLVVEAIEKPGNLGAMVRTADAAGVDAVIAADPAADLYNPNVVRAAQGSLFAVPIAVAGADEVRAWLAGRGIAIFAAGPVGGVPPWHADLTGAVALVIGSEHAGLSPTWSTAPPVTIPMSGSADSLNAATAAAVLIYEATRQRSTATGAGANIGIGT